MKVLLFCAAMLAAGQLPAGAPKNVILFIGDGMSVPQRMVADEFARLSGHGPLAMNKMASVATTRTCSADSLVTDSAAAATAIACGTKTTNGFVGVDPDGKRLVSSAEVARDSGRRVGIVTTVTLTHATPAGFYGHRTSRGQTYALALDLVKSGFDYFAGGGFDGQHDDRNNPLYVGDAYALAASNGYRIVRTRQEFAALRAESGKVLTRFVDGIMPYSIDQDESLPTLAEMTAKGIELLENPAGFFMMVEGGRIDWAGHANDAATNLRDVIAMDEAVKVALDFQRRHPEDTLVVVTGDHETGGLSMGFAGTGYALYLDRLARQTVSVDKFDERVRAFLEANPDAAFADFVNEISSAFGFDLADPPADRRWTLSGDERRQIEKAFEHDREFARSKVRENTKYDGEKRYLLGGVCRLILTHKSGLAWSSPHHTAMPVLTTATGYGAERFGGYIENTDISRTFKEFFGTK